MDLEKLYNVNSLDEWEDLLDRAIGAGDRTAIIILTDYLRWIPKGYRPKSFRVLEYLQHVKYLIDNCEGLVNDWVNLHSCDELREMCNFAVEGRRSQLIKIGDEELIRYVAKGCGVPWLV